MKMVHILKKAVYYVDQLFVTKVRWDEKYDILYAIVIVLFLSIISIKNEKNNNYVHTFIISILSNFKLFFPIYFHFYLFLIERGWEREREREKERDRER